MVARPLTALTQKDKTTGKAVIFEWNTDCEEVFQLLKPMLVTASRFIERILSVDRCQRWGSTGTEG